MINAKNIKKNILSYIRNEKNNSYEAAEEYLENAVYYEEHSNDERAIFFLKQCITLLEQGNSREREAATIIKNSI